MKNYGIILASGSGSRYGDELPKQFVKIAGKTILEHTIEIFEKAKLINKIIIVVTPMYEKKAQEIILKNKYEKIAKIITGGKTRKDSSFIGISSIEENDANVIIHDCARPFVSQEIITNCIEALKTHKAVDVAIQSSDTIIKIKDNFIEEVPNRINLRRGQTPQCFKLSVIKKAHELSKNDDNFTDDCGLILKYNLCPVYVINGDIENIKITYPSDIYIADRLFQLRNSTTPQEELQNLKNKNIVIFGGTSGIGKCISNIAKDNSANVFVASRRTGCDISNYKDVESYLKTIFEKTKKIDYIINSAGLLKIGKLKNRTIEDIKNDIDINYLGTINIIKASIEYLRESKGSILLFTSSSYTRGRALYSTYSSLKAGIVNLAQALSEELIEDNIKINVINPARTATPMRFNAFGKEPEHTLLKPEKVAQVSLKVLLSNFTGQIYDVRLEN